MTDVGARKAALEVGAGNPRQTETDSYNCHERKSWDHHKVCEGNATDGRNLEPPSTRLFWEALEHGAFHPVKGGASRSVNSETRRENWLYSFFTPLLLIEAYWSFPTSILLECAATFCLRRIVCAGVTGDSESVIRLLCRVVWKLSSSKQWGISSHGLMLLNHRYINYYAK